MEFSIGNPVRIIKGRYVMFWSAANRTVSKKTMDKTFWLSVLLLLAAIYGPVFTVLYWLARYQ